MRKYIFGNWKMHGLQAEAVERARALNAKNVPDNAKLAIFPPFTALHDVALLLKSSPIALGAQDCSAEMEGAFTGEVSAPMLKDAGCKYVLLGHSERRTRHAESSALVRQKALKARDMGLIPVICVGETIEARESGNYLDIIRKQLEESLPEMVHSDNTIIAYEPIWAIGAGKTPTTAQIALVHKTIASLLTSATSGAQTPVLYGGSVKAANAREIMMTEYVDGVLVGGASLNAQEFYHIALAADGI